MEQQSVTHSTFVIERSYPATPERVFAMFSDPKKKRRWFAEGDEFAVLEFEMDFRVGGKERIRFRTGDDSPLKGASLTNDTVYCDIVTNRRIVLAYSMAVGEKRMSASLSTFELLPAEQGTKLIFTEQAAFFEDADGPEMRKAGWNLLLNRLDEELKR